MSGDIFAVSPNFLPIPVRSALFLATPSAALETYKLRTSCLESLPKNWIESGSTEHVQHYDSWW